MMLSTVFERKSVKNNFGFKICTNIESFTIAGPVAVFDNLQGHRVRRLQFFRTVGVVCMDK